MKASLLVGGGTAGLNGVRAAKDPCFDFWSETLQDLLVTAAAALPGGIFEATAGRYGPELSLVARCILQALLDAPGLGAELARSLGSR